MTIFRRTRTHSLAAFLLLASAAAVLGSCRRHSAQTTTANAGALLTFERGGPVVGPNSLTVQLTDEHGQPLRLRDPKLEGDMNHAGMKPSFGTLQETTPGTYAGTIDFTMGGDWILLISGNLADGSHYLKKVDVPGVAAK